METVDVKINSVGEYSYPIYIGQGILENAYNYIKKYTDARRFLVVTNDKVYNLYGKNLHSDDAAFVILPDGEEYKNMDVLLSVIDKAVSLKLERKDAIIALGGGVIGDMSGFAASIYQRGIDFIQIPTTLLAQVDSSVGGKVAVNHSAGKNLIGSFYQPKLILADTDVLNTLDDRQFKTGLAEVLKYAFIEKSCLADNDYMFMEFLESGRHEILSKNPKFISNIVKTCCLLKSSVVNKDEKEKGLRSILNFGHTYAHAIENITNYTEYTHGEAVSIGMKHIFDLALNLSMITEEYYIRAIKLLEDYSLITKANNKLDKDQFYTAMHSDKKVSSGKIKFVMPCALKEVIIKSDIDKNLVLRGI